VHLTTIIYFLTQNFYVMVRINFHQVWKDQIILTQDPTSYRESERTRDLIRTLQQRRE